MDDQQLRDLLVRAAELPGGPVGAPSGLAGRVRRRRVRVRSLSLVGVAIVVAAATAVPTITMQSGASRRSPVSPPGSVAPAPLVSTAGTAAALATDEWTQLPPAPLAGRVPAAAVWDGAQMLVWGGAVGSTLFADGAAYDPIGHVWTKLPRSPLSARSNSAYVWTGDELFVWGGLDANAGSGHYANDGALYNPSTRTWRMLPPAPLPATVAPQALLVDGQVVVLPRDVPTGTARSATPAAAYNPASNAWRRIAPLPLAPQGQYFTVTAVSTGKGIIAWEAWGSRSTLNDSTTSYSAGLASYRYDTKANHWSVDSSGDGPPARVEKALWTGRQILVPATVQCPLGYQCAATTGGHGYALNVVTNTWSAIARGPVDAFNPTSVWTGAALLSFDASAGSGAAGSGGAAAWDPSTDTWTTLPTAPYAGDVAAVWTGSSLLVWGPMSRTSDFDGTHPPVVSTVGLELGPVPTAVGRPGMFNPSPPTNGH